MCEGGGIRTLDTNMDVVLLTLLDLAGIFIRFRERVESLEILDGHTRAGEGFVYVRVVWLQRMDVGLGLLVENRVVGGSRVVCG